MDRVMTAMGCGMAAAVWNCGKCLFLSPVPDNCASRSVLAAFAGRTCTLSTAT